MSNKFTPGPWKMQESSTRPVTVYSDRGSIAYLSWVGSESNNQTSVANAHLIAAAPDLLEALQGLMYQDCGEPAFINARAAIAKATGGEV